MEKTKQVKKVYLLSESYKDDDPEVIGAYDSMRAVCKAFAERIASEHVEMIQVNEVDKDIVNFAMRIAHDLARLIPDLLQVEFAADECVDGKTKFSVSSYDVESVEEESDEEEEA